MSQIVVGNWGVTVHVDTLPPAHDWYVEHALLAEEFDIKSKGRLFFLAVGIFDPSVREYWKSLLTVAQRYSPDERAGYEPGVLIVPETARLFVGAGERLLAYDLNAPARLWEDHADCGFFNWGRHGAYVWMAAELEFAVWSTSGVKLWTTFVEPPWEASFNGDNVTLDVMGNKHSLRLSDGRSIAE
jgi:hypothetical protein